MTNKENRIGDFFRTIQKFETNMKNKGEKITKKKVVDEVILELIDNIKPLSVKPGVAPKATRYIKENLELIAAKQFDQLQKRFLESKKLVLLPSEISTLEKLQESHTKFLDANPDLCAKNDLTARLCKQGGSGYGESRSDAFQNLLRSTKIMEKVRIEEKLRDEREKLARLAELREQSSSSKNLKEPVKVSKSIKVQKTEIIPDTKKIEKSKIIEPKKIEKLQEIKKIEKEVKKEPEVNKIEKEQDVKRAEKLKEIKKVDTNKVDKNRKNSDSNKTIKIKDDSSKSKDNNVSDSSKNNNSSKNKTNCKMEKTDDKKPDSNGLVKVSDSGLKNKEDITDEQRTIAMKSYDLFKAKEYVDCLRNLNLLHSSRPNDRKIKMNIAVTNFCKSGCKNVSEFQRVLDAILKEINMETHAKRLHIETKMSKEELQALAPLFYNVAVAFRAEQKAFDASGVLSRCVLPVLMCLDSNLTKKIVMLYVELQLFTCQPQRAIELLESQSVPRQKCLKGASEKVDEFDLQLSYSKARCFLLLEALRASRVELKLLTSQIGFSLPILHLKSSYEYLRGNYRKAIKFLNQSMNDTMSTTLSTSVVTAATLLYYNNMSVIHGGLKKHTLASMYASKAFEMADKSKGCRTSNQKRARLAMIYNVGVSMLQAGKHRTAYQCLRLCEQSYIKNPRVYLRLAECCVAEHEANIAQNLNEGEGCYIPETTTNYEVKCKVYGKCLRGCTTSSYTPTNEMNLEQGFAYLQTGLSLATIVNHSQKKDDKTLRPFEYSIMETSGFVENIPGMPLNREDIFKVRCALLSNAAYICLELEDYYRALEFAKSILSMHNVPCEYIFQAKSYAAEAYLYIDKPTESLNLYTDNIEILHCSIEVLRAAKKPNTPHVISSDVNDDSDKPDSVRVRNDEWSLYDARQADAISRLNLCTIYAIRGEYRMAKQFLNTTPEFVNLHVHRCHINVFLTLVQGIKLDIKEVLENSDGCHIADEMYIS